MQKISRTFTSTCISITLRLVATTCVLLMVQYSFEIVPSPTKSKRHRFRLRIFFLIIGFLPFLYGVSFSLSFAHTLSSILNFYLIFKYRVASQTTFRLYYFVYQEKKMHHPALGPITNEFLRFDRRFPSSQVLLLFFYLRNFPFPYIRYLYSVHISVIRICVPKMHSHTDPRSLIKWNKDFEDMCARVCECLCEKQREKGSRRSRVCACIYQTATVLNSFRQ